MPLAFLVQHVGPRTAPAPPLHFVHLFAAQSGNRPAFHAALESLAKEVHEEFAFRRKLAAESVEELYGEVKWDFQGSSLFVLWKQVGSNSCYVFVLDPVENRTAALNVLTQLPTLLGDLYKNPLVGSNPKELLLRPEDISYLLEALVPNGQLLCTTTPFMKHLRRNVELAVVK